MYVCMYVYMYIYMYVYMYLLTIPPGITAAPSLWFCRLGACTGDQNSFQIEL